MRNLFLNLDKVDRVGKAEIAEKAKKANILKKK
jgi:hypothetical protein